MANGGRWRPRPLPALLVLVLLLALGLVDPGGRDPQRTAGRPPATAVLVALPVTADVAADVRPLGQIIARVGRTGLSTAVVVLSGGGTPAAHPVAWWPPSTWIALVLAGVAAWRGRAPPGTGVAVFSARA